MTFQIQIDRVCDANDDPVEAAQINLYLPGTTTPVAIYADAALTTALPNPLTTDATGYPEHLNIYAASRVDMVARTSGGATISGYTRTPPAVPVSGSSAATIAFDPTTDLPYDDVQDALVGVSGRIDAQIAAAGWGETDASPLLASWDGTAIEGGAYRWDNTAGGTGPTGWDTLAGAALFLRSGATTGTMVAFSADGMQFRGQDGAWGTWRNVAHDGRVAADADAQTGTGTGYMTAAKTKLAIEAQVNTRRRVGSADTPFEPTPGSLIEWAHGLPSRPVLVSLRLRCITADGGYSPGDEVFISATPKSDFSRGHTLYIDNDTHVKVRISSDTNPFEFCQKGSATIFYPDTTKWGLIITAQV